jgi:uncharacterized Rmd1/YagE family protein
MMAAKKTGRMINVFFMVRVKSHNINLFNKKPNLKRDIKIIFVMAGMEKTVNLSAIRVADELDLKAIKNSVEAKPGADSTYELFYSSAPDKYIDYFNYGVVVFFNHTDDEIRTAIDKIQGAGKNPGAAWLRENYAVKITHQSPPTSATVPPRFEFDHLVTTRFDVKMARTAMFNLAQSVALDHYHELSETLLREVRRFTTNLEATGKLRINRKNMMKFIGRALNTQNDIADNIYIFASPEQVWDDPDLDALHQGLLKHFDLRVRVSEIEYTLRIIEDNLKVFLQISNQRESNTLEWIIIILILVEILNIFITQWFH